MCRNRPNFAWLLSLCILSWLATFDLSLAQSAKNLSIECNHEYIKWRKQPGFGAFAASRHGACSWISAQSNLSDAKAKVLKSCREIYGSTHCKVVGQSNEAGQIDSPKESKVALDECIDIKTKDRSSAIAACRKAEKELGTIANKSDGLRARAGILYIIGEHYLAMKEYEKAIESIDVALKLNDKSPEAHFGKGKIFLVIGKLAESQAELSLASNFIPKSEKEFAKQIAELQKHVTDVIAEMDALSNEQLCKNAMDVATAEWKTGNEDGNLIYIAEAKRRYLNIRKCLNLLGIDGAGNSKEDDQIIVVDLPKDTSPKVEIAENNSKVEGSYFSKRVALVIGNTTYQHSDPLPNATRDSAAIANILRRLGFEVFEHSDLSKTGMSEAVDVFRSESDDADLALFFFAGHGMQVDGKNFLIPIDFDVAKVKSMDASALNASRLSEFLGGEDRIGIMILDACRNNPFARGLNIKKKNRSLAVGQGLAPYADAGSGLYVLYATSPNNVSQDGEGGNSPFTTALIKYLPNSKVSFQKIAQKVTKEVKTITEGDQIPWTASDIDDDLFLGPKS